MNIANYPYKANPNFLDYEFVSIGPKGNIKKVVRFTDIGDDIFNLGFGDLDDETGDISDTTVTDNKDSQKVLATVAHTVYHFFSAYPYADVFLTGSTPARTRLYRMGISGYWRQISVDFEVYGLRQNQWETFQFQRDYDAFLIRQRIS